jgi:trehalose/maltose hydrolase-like predicted phosphorylase
MIPSERTWQITEAPFIVGKLHHVETIFTIGNGYLGLRGTFEEGYPRELVSTLVHGVYDHAEGELVPELVNVPNPLSIIVEVDGEPFHMEKGKILGYRRTLDLEEAILRREVLWRSSQGAIVQISFERFASLAREHLVAQRVSVRALNKPCTIAVTASIDGTQTNEGVKHWGSQETGAEGDTIWVMGRTGQSGYGVAVMSTLVPAQEVDSRQVSAKNTLQPAIRVERRLEVDQAAVFDKLSAIHSTRDADDPLTAARETLASAESRGWERLKAEHVEEWAKYWHDSGIEIEGDEQAQRAVRFAAYHVLIAAPRHDDQVSIGAKTLSGPGYKGHVFWDTELFILPMLTATQPRLAHNLLMYRYHKLQGARNKAREAGYEGAMFPWESTDTGEETTPRWTNPQPDGTRIRIWTGDTEQHISTDITYAIMQYWRWTGDEEFFVKYGAEIVLDTAVFWGSRVEYNADQDRYELPMQIGPDEYHENINNSAFTNTMMRWHLQTAIEVAEWLERNHPAEAKALLTRLGITPERIERWRQIIDKMYIPYDEERHILEQYEGFFNLKPLNLAHWQPRVTNMDAILGREMTQETMVIKQADIVMLMALLGDEFGSREDRLRNWEFYSKIVDHGSSLSPAIHAWVAARLGLIEEAYRLFMYAASIDLEDAKGNVRDGIHAAAAGGLWLAVVFGFAGLKIEDSNFMLDPKLPEHWKSLAFRVYFRGKQYAVRLTAP